MVVCPRCTWQSPGRQSCYAPFQPMAISKVTSGYMFSVSPLSPALLLYMVKSLLEAPSSLPGKLVEPSRVPRSLHPKPSSASSHSLLCSKWCLKFNPDHVQPPFKSSQSHTHRVKSKMLNVAIRSFNRKTVGATYIIKVFLPCSIKSN